MIPTNTLVHGIHSIITLKVQGHLEKLNDDEGYYLRVERVEKG